MNSQGGNRMDISIEVTSTLLAENHGHLPCVMSAGFCTGHSAASRSVGYGEECASTLRAGAVPAAVYENHRQDARYTGPLDTAPTVSATYGTGGSNQPFVVAEPDTVCYGIGRNAFNQGKAAQFAPSISAQIQPPLVANGPGAVQKSCIVRRLTPTECARLQGFPDWWCSDLETLEPTEADIAFWSEVWETHRRIIGTAARPKTRSQIIKWLKSPHSNSAEYKMWGNGVALPNVFFVLAGIVWSAQSDLNVFKSCTNPV